MPTLKDCIITAPSTGACEIDIEKAKQILDTTIFELIPTNTTRQTRINKFFTEYEFLKGLIPAATVPIILNCFG